MITFKQFFKESVDKIPVLDGEREIYEIIFFPEFEDDYYQTDSKSKNSKLARIRPIRYNWWDRKGVEAYKEKTRYVGRDVNEALDELEQTLSFCDMYLPPDFISSDPHFRTIKDLMGVWKVIWRVDVKIVHLGIEIDVDAYKPLSHTADDLLGF